MSESKPPQSVSSVPGASESIDDLLDQMVKEHLSGSPPSSSPAAQATPAASSTPASASTVTRKSEIDGVKKATVEGEVPVDVAARNLQQEIAALLGTNDFQAKVALEESKPNVQAESAGVEIKMDQPEDLNEGGSVEIKMEGFRGEEKKEDTVNSDELDALLLRDAEVKVKTPHEDQAAKGGDKELVADMSSHVEDAQVTVTEELDQLLQSSEKKKVEAIYDNSGVLPGESREDKNKQQINDETQEDQKVAKHSNDETIAASTVSQTNLDVGISREETQALRAELTAGDAPEDIKKVKSQAEAVKAKKVKAKRQGNGLLHDMLLMFAQILDIPFSWLPGEVKSLTAVAGVLLLLTGAILFVIAYMKGG